MRDIGIGEQKLRNLFPILDVGVDEVNGPVFMYFDGVQDGGRGVEVEEVSMRKLNQLCISHAVEGRSYTNGWSWVALREESLGGGGLHELGGVLVDDEFHVWELGFKLLELQVDPFTNKGKTTGILAIVAFMNETEIMTFGEPVHDAGHAAETRRGLHDIADIPSIAVGFSPVLLGELIAGDRVIDDGVFVDNEGPPLAIFLHARNAGSDLGMTAPFVFGGDVVDMVLGLSDRTIVEPDKSAVEVLGVPATLGAEELVDRDTCAMLEFACFLKPDVLDIGGLDFSGNHIDGVVWQNADPVDDHSDVTDCFGSVLGPLDVVDVG